MSDMQNTLNVEYDFVGIVDALPETERQSHQISDKLKQLLEGLHFRCEKADCNTKRAVVRALQGFRDRAHAGEKFSLHFVSHGSASGLWLKGTNETIEWPEFRSYLSAINTAMNGALILNMSTCQGLHGIKVVDSQANELPFFGLIGVSRILFPDEAIRLNERLYSKWAAGTPIQTIIRDISTDPGGEVLDCITAEGYKRLSQK